MPNKILRFCNNGEMSDSFRSKHAGKPGSLMAIRVDYPLATQAFEAVPRDSVAYQRKAEVTKFASGLRIGEKADWNASTVDELHRFPVHAPIRTLSEFQGVKLEYNFRANTLPSVNKDTIFVRKPNKMQIDESLFLSEQDRKKIVPKCPGTTCDLSRREIQNNSHQHDSERGWNCSNALPEERASVFKTPQYERRLEKNKKKNILHTDSYVPPHEAYDITAQIRRDEKVLKRLKDSPSPNNSISRSLGSSRTFDGGNSNIPTMVSAGGTVVVAGAPVVFKMSNRSDWWDKNPLVTPTVTPSGGEGSKEAEQDQ